MLTFRSIAAGAISEANAYTAHLLEQTLPEEDMAMAEYYARTHGLDEALAAGMGAVPSVRANLDPQFLDLLGLKAGQTIAESELAAILSGRRANGSDIPGSEGRINKSYTTKDGKERHRLSGMDLCFSAPKSVSVAWAFARTEAERQSILQAHRDARNSALQYVEHEVGKAVLGHSGQGGTHKGKLAWITIDHFTSRPTVTIKRADPETGVQGTELYTLNARQAGDMQLHTHTIIPNVIVTQDGRHASINSKYFHGRIHEFGAVYQAFLAKNLREMGIEVQLDQKTHTATLPTIPENVCKEFSKRTADAEEAARMEASSRGEDWDAMTPDAKVAFMKGGAKASRRSKTDDLANFAAWKEQAEKLGWKHETAVNWFKDAVTDRIAKAYHIVKPIFADRLYKSAVVTGFEARLDAARSLIDAGIETTDDISAVTRKMATEGVTHHGEDTHLVWVNGDDGVKITTALQKDEEGELIRLVQEAVSTPAGVDAKPDPRFTPEQRDALHKLATGGALSLLIGSAGAGKTFLLSPLVAAHKAKGRKVYGTAQAWRQAEALKDAGVDDAFALKKLLVGKVKLDADSVVILDELSQIGTHELLQLLRLRAQHGFQIVTVGDDRQAQSISAGPVIDLLRRALGPEAVPEILSTIRQRTEREREIAGKFRDGKADEAFTMKREDGTAELVEGGRQEAINRIAELAVERDATVSAPTNADALDIGRAIRAARGISGGFNVQATDGAGNAYDLQLAAGEKVRLFSRVHAPFEGNGGLVSHLGNNGSVLEVVSADSDGVKLKTANGKTAFVAWSRLRDEGSGRIKLAYGYCLTIDSAQGLTSDNHILACPSGSAGIDGFKAYVGASRHRIASWFIASKGVEMQAVQGKRPLGAPGPITDDMMWANIGANLSRQTVKESATSMLSEAAEGSVKTAKAFQKGMMSMEWNKHVGKPATTLKKRWANRWFATIKQQWSNTWNFRPGL